MTRLQAQAILRYRYGSSGEDTEYGLGSQLGKQKILKEIDKASEDSISKAWIIHG